MSGRNETVSGWTGRALVVEEHGGPDVLQVQEQTIDDPTGGQVVVEVAASGVNFIDIYQREGIYPMRTPFVLGQEGAGTIRAAGEGVKGLKVGDQVAWASVGMGSHAKYVSLPYTGLIPTPKAMDPELAAAVMLQGMTAHYLVSSTYVVQSGDHVLVHAAAGGVGQLLVQMITARGASVIATVSTQEKADLVTDLGAHTVLRYDELNETKQLVEAIRTATGGKGVQVAYDGVGASTFEASLGSLARRGMLVLFGASSGQVPPFDLQRLNSAGSVFVTRPSLGAYIATRDEMIWRGRDVLSSAAAGNLKVQIHKRYKLTEAATAYDDLASRRTSGKLLLIP
jgi:NADPH2:quinone reductase